MLVRGIAAERRQDMIEAASGGDREHRIREIAYFIWLEEGCPSGRDQEHWQRASDRVALLEAAVKPLPKTAPLPKVAAKAAKKPAITARKTSPKR
jgi:hypothetical protein